MAISAREAADAHFVSEADGYDAVQVETYVARVAATLSQQERELAEARAEIGRLEHALDLAHVAQSTAPSPRVESTGRVLGEALTTAGADQVDLAALGGAVPPAPLSDPVASLAEWTAERDRAHLAGAALEAAEEDARRLRGVANALAAEAAIARHGVQMGLSPIAQEEAELRALETLETAETEAAELLEVALAEARNIVGSAERSADAVTRAAAREARDLNQRTAQLRTVLRDAGSRFAELAGDTRTEIRMLEDFIDLEMHGVDDLEVLEPTETAAVDLRTVGSEEQRPSADSGSEAQASPGFYERRLAGLRERLENT